VVEGARLESVCRGNSTEGSNPSLSANMIFFVFNQLVGDVDHRLKVSRRLGKKPTLTLAPNARICSSAYRRTIR
jgi:hypothetical protein